MLKSFKYRLYPTSAQQVALNKHFGCVRFIYNWGLQKKNSAYATTGESPSIFTLAKELPKMKNEMPWLKEINSQSLQKSLLNLDMAFTNFFRRVKRGDQCRGFPTFKKKKYRQSFQCPQSGSVDFKKGKISIPKISEIPVVLSRKFKGEIKTTTISKAPSGKYFVSFLVEDGKEPSKKTPIEKSNSIGIDIGIKHLIVLSNGEKVGNPNFCKVGKERIALLDKRMRRKKKGSKNRNKARIKLARQHERVANQRTDFLQKLSTRLIRENQTICLEDLNVKGMTKNHSLAGSIMDASWSELTRMLQYKSDWYGKNLVFIGRFKPSSKMCSGCGNIKSDLTLGTRRWKCNKCGEEHDRDTNAAKNILRFALVKQNLINQVPLDERKVTLGELTPLLSCSNTGKKELTGNQESIAKI